MPPKSKMPEPPVRSKTYKAPGRLSDLRKELYQDPRASAKLIDVLRQYGLERKRTPSSLDWLNTGSTMEDLGNSAAEVETELEQVYNALPNTLPEDTIELDTERAQRIISGPNGTEITLYIYRPTLKGGALPCIVYLHGGAMTMLKTTNKVHARWCTSLAATGMTVVAVKFRNAWMDGDFNHFPAGLEDCCAAVQWIHAHKDYLNIRNVVLQGDGGGANLALATALKAKRDGWSYKIDGVYANAPMISGAYHWSDERKLRELPSLIECHGYFINVGFQAYMARVYTPNSEDWTNPLAWPYHARISDMEGLPPHVLSVDELDPFRDEGMAYFRKLTSAGVSCSGQVNLGQTHAASLIFRQALPTFHKTAVRQIAQFAKFV